METPAVAVATHLEQAHGGREGSGAHVRVFHPPIIARSDAIGTGQTDPRHLSVDAPHVRRNRLKA